MNATSSNFSRRNGTYHLSRRGASVLMLASVLLAGATQAQTTRPAYVDLRPMQTALKDQGNRTTCITFAAVAALEAAYKRDRSLTLNLSEQFTNHMGKTFWLHPYWLEVAARGAAGSESQVGAYGGGSGVGYLEQFADKFRIPPASTMPYTPYATDPNGLPPYEPLQTHLWTDPFWTVQRNQDDFNLSPYLPLAALKSPVYYGASGTTRVNARSAADIEAALAAGKEVVWDFEVANTGTSADPIWRPCAAGQPACPAGGHSMLIVGYDRRSADASQHHFIVKNSWGTTATAPGSGGYTYIAYDYLQHGTTAAYVTGVKPPAPWPELRFVGRWKLDFDGFKGELDIHHLPGQSTVPWRTYSITDADLRLGTYYDASGQAYRVNGSVANDTITFYIDGANANAKWDQLGGRKFTYKIVRAPWGEMMAGTHQDVPGGIQIGGYARKSAFLNPSSAAPRPLAPASYLGANWDATFDNRQGTFNFTSVDTAASTATTTVLRGTFSIGVGLSVPATATIPVGNAREITLSVPIYSATLKGWFHNWEPGVVSGTSTTGTTATGGFVMTRR